MFINNGDKLLIGEVMYKVLGEVNGSYKLQDVVDFTTHELGVHDPTFVGTSLEFPITVRYNGKPQIVPCGAPHGLSRYQMTNGDIFTLEVYGHYGNVHCDVCLPDKSVLQGVKLDNLELLTKDIFLENTVTGDILNNEPITTIEGIIKSLGTVLCYPDYTDMHRMVTEPVCDIFNCKPSYHYVRYGSMLYAIKDTYDYMFVAENVVTHECKGFMYNSSVSETLTEKPVLVRYTGVETEMPVWYDRYHSRQYHVFNDTPLVLLDWGTSYAVCTPNREWLCDINSKEFAEFEILTQTFNVYNATKREYTSEQGFSTLEEALAYRDTIKRGLIAEHSINDTYHICAN